MHYNRTTLTADAAMETSLYETARLCIAEEAEGKFQSYKL